MSQREATPYRPGDWVVAGDDVVQVFVTQLLAVYDEDPHNRTVWLISPAWPDNGFERSNEAFFQRHATPDEIAAACMASPEDL